MGNTLIQISDELWKELNDRKTPDNKSFEEVIWKILLGDKNEC
tara:strand:+ start:2895 stop:3023 length:129 start_codon:yes stop_codon:yes gene_type:complete